MFGSECIKSKCPWFTTELLNLFCDGDQLGKSSTMWATQKSAYKMKNE
jgi:hypothetical protein